MNINNNKITITNITNINKKRVVQNNTELIEHISSHIIGGKTMWGS